jgi:hypothetical protein
MNYFQKYERLKKANALITSGSIWEDYLGEVKVLYATSINVYYTNLPSGERGEYSLNNFKKHFHLVG